MRFPLFTLLLCFLHSIYADDFYEILGVKRDASTREIRKGFKKVALIKHPDKNREDPDAHDNFLRINRAYEVLKDEELRKIYNEKGEKGLEKENGPSGNNYQNWNFYKNEFGIYDDDVEVITLSKSDFQQLVSNTNEVWFVNYYSPRCSHCHTLAPAWREVARDMEGVIRIGAVNCMDEWLLCNQQGISSYPSIIEYPKGQKYKGDKSKDSLVDYMLKVADIHLHDLTNEKSLYEYEEQMMVTFCGQGECLSKISCLKLTSIFNGLVLIAVINCDIYESLCLKYGQTQGTFYYESGPRSSPVEIHSLDVKEITSLLLKRLPELSFLNEDEMKMLSENTNEQAFLLHFIDGVQYENEQKKIPSLIDEGIQFRLVDCSLSTDFCATMYMSKRPSFALIRPTHGIDVHYGRSIVHDVVAFAHDSVRMPCKTLSPVDFPINSEMWFIDFFAPWCPPCMKLLPEFRKASREVEDVHFGSVDCTIHSGICEEYGISSYPTTIVFNETKPIHFNGEHTSEALVEFISDIRDPPVIIMDDDIFEEVVMGRDDKKVVLVDFFAPWCGPCQQLSPVWRKVAKQFKNNKMISLGSVDCTEYSNLCNSQGIHSYPTIRAYEMGANKMSFKKYNNWERDEFSIRAWASEFLPQNVIKLSSETFEKKVLNRKDSSVWLVDFFSPWCGPCKQFAPIFEDIAITLKGHVKSATVDCQRHGHLCQFAGITSYPSVRLYLNAKDKKGITVSHFDKKALIKTVRKYIADKKKKVHDEF